MKKNLLISVVALLPILAYSVYKMLKANPNGEMYLGSIKYLGKQQMIDKAMLMDDGRFICNGKEEPNQNIEIHFIQSSNKLGLDKILDICIARNNEEKNRFDILISGYRNSQFYVKSGWMSDEGQE